METRETRSKTEIRIDAVRQLIMWHFLSGKRPFYLVCEFPKSGGSWMAQMLSSYFDIPFPRNRNVSLLKEPSSVLHGHHVYNKNFKNCVYLLRDGRDIMVSAYYHKLFHNDKNPSWAVDSLRSDLNFENFEDIKLNLPKFIEYMFTIYPKPYFHFSWSEFIRSIYCPSRMAKTIVVKYEELLNNTVLSTSRVIEELTTAKVDQEKLNKICSDYSFKNQAKRNAGEENTKSFLRKGIAGDWENQFTRKACEVFDIYGGDELILAGYEQDHSWVKTIQ